MLPYFLTIALFAWLAQYIGYPLALFCWLFIGWVFDMLLVYNVPEAYRQIIIDLTTEKKMTSRKVTLIITSCCLVLWPTLIYKSFINPDRE